MMPKLFSFQRPDPKKKPEATAAVRKKVYRSEELFGEDREIVIEHGDAIYRLQITKAGKLILNK